MIKPNIAASLYYSGDAAFFCANENSLQNLKIGNEKIIRKGVITDLHRKKFVSRCIYMAENCKSEIFTFVLTYNMNAHKTGITKDTKSHINSFLQFLKKQRKVDYYGNKGVKGEYMFKGLNDFAYTLELTENNVYHYHFIIDCQRLCPKFLNDAWVKITGQKALNEYGNPYFNIKTRSNNVTNALRAYKKLYTKTKRGAKNSGKIAKAAGYAAKYFTKASKNENEDFKNLRRFATSHQLARAKIKIQIDGKFLRKLLPDMKVLFTKMITINQNKGHKMIETVNKNVCELVTIDNNSIKKYWKLLINYEKLLLKRSYKSYLSYASEMADFTRGFSKKNALNLCVNYDTLGNILQTSNYSIKKINTFDEQTLINFI